MNNSKHSRDECLLGMPLSLRKTTFECSRDTEVSRTMTPVEDEQVDPKGNGETRKHTLNANTYIKDTVIDIIRVRELCKINV